MEEILFRFYYKMKHWEDFSSYRQRHGFIKNCVYGAKTLFYRALIFTCLIIFLVLFAVLAPVASILYLLIGAFDYYKSGVILSQPRRLRKHEIVG
jgi:hypothetical protein